MRPRAISRHSPDYQAPWDVNYHMDDYVNKELPALIEEHFNVTGDRSVMGHSMGGHGALTCAMRNPGM